MIHNLWHSITHHESQQLAQYITSWLTTTVILSQWLSIMVCYAGSVVVNHDVLCWASGCESGCGMLSQWLWIMVCYADPVVVNQSELWWAPRITTTGSVYHIMINNHWLIIAHHHSQPLSQYNTSWLTTTDSGYAVSKVVNHGVLF
jgi:hypothetical protein